MVLFRVVDAGKAAMIHLQPKPGGPFDSKKGGFMRGMERELRDAVRYIGSSGEIKEKPKQKRARRPSAMEKRLMQAKKALGRRSL